jgi:hypothetical protein
VKREAGPLRPGEREFGIQSDRLFEILFAPCERLTVDHSRVGLADDAGTLRFKILRAGSIRESDRAGIQSVCRQPSNSSSWLSSEEVRLWMGWSVSQSAPKTSKQTECLWLDNGMSAGALSCWRWRSTCHHALFWCAVALRPNRSAIHSFVDSEPGQPIVSAPPMRRRIGAMVAVENM